MSQLYRSHNGNWKAAAWFHGQWEVHEAKHMWDGYRIGAHPVSTGGSLRASQNRVTGDSPSADRTRDIHYAVGRITFQKSRSVHMHRKHSCHTGGTRRGSYPSSRSEH